MSLTCGGQFFRVVCILLLLADIGVGWYNYHQLREDIHTFDVKNPHTYCTENRIQTFWKVYLGFELAATLFKVFQILKLSIELCEDEKSSAACPFFLVILSYCAEIGSALTTIIFMQHCACRDLSPSTWTIGQAEMVQKLVSGAGLVSLQLLIHATSIVNKCCAINHVAKYMKKDKDPGDCITNLNIVFFLAYLGTFGAEVYYAFCS